jgi:hypothetical protein
MKNADKTSCPKDHPYDEGNTYIGKQTEKAGGGVRRQCKKCQRAVEIRCRLAARKRKRRLAALALTALGSCSLMDFGEAIVEPVTVGVAAAGGGLLAGPAGAAVGAASASAAWDVVAAEEDTEKAEEGEAEAVAKVDAITHAALTGELDPLRDALADKGAELTGLAATLEALKFWTILGAIVWGVFYALRHAKDIVAFLRFIKVLRSKSV